MLSSVPEKRCYGTTTCSVYTRYSPILLWMVRLHRSWDCCCKIKASLQIITVIRWLMSMEFKVPLRLSNFYFILSYLRFWGEKWVISGMKNGLKITSAPRLSREYLERTSKLKSRLVWKCKRDFDLHPFPSQTKRSGFSTNHLLLSPKKSNISKYFVSTWHVGELANGPKLSPICGKKGQNLEKKRHWKFLIYATNYGALVQWPYNIPQI